METNPKYEIAFFMPYLCAFGDVYCDFIEQNCHVLLSQVSHIINDTTILLDGNTSSLGAALNILEVFGSLSGLIVNAEKTKMVWIGSKRFSKDQLNVPAKLK